MRYRFAPRGAGRRRTHRGDHLQAIYATIAPECGTAPVSAKVGKDLKPSVRGRREDGGWSDFCVYAGLIAARCPGEAERSRPYTRPLWNGWYGWVGGGQPIMQDGVPWRDLAQASAGIGGSCVIPGAQARAYEGDY